LDITACILGNAISGAKKTHVMYGCNLSHNQFQVYLDFLLESGLISLRKKSDVGILETTDEGREFIKAYLKLKDFLAT
jgi:predicted transcriptional regulator